MTDLNETLAGMGFELEHGYPYPIKEGLALLAAVQNVLALHRDDAGTCVECSQGRSVTFPCPTLWAISDALLASEPSGSER